MQGKETYIQWCLHSLYIAIAMFLQLGYPSCTLLSYLFFMHENVMILCGDFS